VGILTTDADPPDTYSRLGGTHYKNTVICSQDSNQVPVHRSLAEPLVLFTQPLRGAIFRTSP
jgi:hypothetical protein